MSALMLFRGNLDVLGAAGTYALRTFGDLLLPLSVGLMLLWILVPLSVSYVAFRKKGVL